ncbi:ABC transporter ATP-binding protein/permease [Christensenellaceae bacterium OttesenSCG-928-K19]|nr:ABC transporter ATP-binding protein/permease [Christensenellaceae bacterium OttesenSCG-928-K19]
MKKLFPYLKQFRREVISGPVFKLVEAIFELIVPLVMANIIDIGVKNADSGYVLQKGGLMIVLSAIGLACTLVCQYLAARASQGFGTVLRNSLFSHIGSLSHTELDKFGTPTLITRITSDVNQLQLALAMFIRLAVRAPFLVVGATIMAMSIDMKLSLIFLAVAVLIALALYLIMSRSTPFYSLVQKLLDRVSLLTRETLSGARPIRAFSRQRQQQDKFEEANDELQKTSVRVGRLSALLNPMTFLIVNTGIIAILWFGGQGVMAGDLQQGHIIALVNYMTQILLALIVVANLVILFTRAGASARRVTEVLETQPSIIDRGNTPLPFDANTPAVEFRDVSFRYVEGECELEHVSLKIGRGQWAGIIGGTGAGKTTLINLIPRFYDATAGEVLVSGENVKDYPLDELRGSIGIVPQRAVLFSGTVRENMRWGDGDATDEQIWEALEVAQAAGFVRRHKDGLNMRLSQNGQNLSGGQRQRLAIARALIRRPQLLILDDSMSALDFATEAALRKALRGFKEGMTVILVSQRAAALKTADSIIVLDDGEVSGRGTHDELFESNAVYREIVLSQTGGAGHA